MQRITTATKAANLFGAGKDGFKDGDLVNGVAATDLNAAWFNGMQEELLAVIEAAGIAPSAGTLNQLLTAMRSSGVFTTPAQFDATTKAATTAFVKGQGLQASALATVTATGTLTAAAAVGATVAVNSASATTQTIPAANAVPAGARIELMNINTGVATISRAGADTLQVNNSTVTSLPLAGGDTLTLESDGVSKWYAVGGSAQLQYSNVLGPSSASPNLQRLPGGRILQWGTGTTSSGGDVTVAFPITFPTALLGLGAVYINGSGSANVTLTAGNTTTSGANWGSFVPSTGARNSSSFMFVASGN